MAHIGGEIVIRRPINEVFDFVADERNEPRYNPRMRYAEKVSPGPIGPGTRFRAATTAMGLRTAEMTIEITGYDRPGRLASSTQVSTMDINGELTFAAVREGTRLRWSWDVDTVRCSKLLAPVVARLAGRQEQRIWTNLKQVLEGHARPLGSPELVGPRGRRLRRALARGASGVAAKRRPKWFRVHRNDRRWLPRWLRVAAQRCWRCTSRSTRGTR